MLRTMSSAELVDEPDAIGELNGGEIVGKVKRSTVEAFRFPPQEHGFDGGDTADDPVSQKTWTVVDVDEEHGTIDLKIGKRPTPLCRGPSSRVVPINTKNLAGPLARPGRTSRAIGLRRGDAAAALLLRLRPDTGEPDGAAATTDEEPASEAAHRIILGLERFVSPIQGPPASGKTFTAAGASLGSSQAGRTVGVTAPSHAVIQNLLDEVVKQAASTATHAHRTETRSVTSDFSTRHAESLDYGPAPRQARARELDIVAGTVWLWAREEFAHSVDTLFVDEAGQFSLANVLASPGPPQPRAARATRSSWPSRARGPPAGRGSLGARPRAGRARHHARRPPGSSSTGPTACIPTCAGTPPRSSTTDRLERDRRTSVPACAGDIVELCRRRACASSR